MTRSRRYSKSTASGAAFQPSNQHPQVHKPCLRRRCRLHNRTPLPLHYHLRPSQIPRLPITRPNTNLQPHSSRETSRNPPYLECTARSHPISPHTTCLRCQNPRPSLSANPPCFHPLIPTPRLPATAPWVYPPMRGACASKIPPG